MIKMGAAECAEMRITMFDLNGVWEMQKDGEESWYPASVPGTMYKDLLGNGRIEDPFYGENEFAARELSADNYRYRRSFTVSGELLKNEKNVLVCKGIDTLADITLNGQPIGHCENMHREYRFDITSVLREGENEIEVFFLCAACLCETAERAKADLGRGHDGSRLSVHPQGALYVWMGLGPAASGSGNLARHLY